MTDAELQHYSKALGEIWRLRALLAYEATQMPERLRYRTLPLAVRGSLEAAQLRALRAANGRSAEVCHPLDDLQARLCEIGANPGLTREQWEAEAKESSPVEVLYYIQDTRSIVGNCAMWWRAERKGYACDIRDAGKYGEKEAREIEQSRGTDRAFRCDVIDPLAIPHVRADVPPLSAWEAKARE